MSERGSDPVVDEESDELELVAVPTPPPFQQRDDADVAPWSVPPPGGFAELRKTLHTPHS